MKKKLILSLMGLGMIASASAIEKAEPVVADSTGFKFTDVISLKTTPVKDQNISGTCWSFAATGLLENEIYKNTGKVVDLSEMFVVHHCYLDKAVKYLRMCGTINFEQGGSLADVPYVLKNYGAVPEEAYKGLEYGETEHNHAELIAVVKNYMAGVNSLPNKKTTTAWYRGLEAILNAYLGEMPKTFTVDGKEYTPESYAKFLGLNADDYVSYTSFTHHPFYTEFPIEVADNWLWAESVNLPQEEMKAIVDNALKNGYSVAWAADVSEKSFQWKNGFAILPAEKKFEDMAESDQQRWSKLSDKERKEEAFKFDGPVPEIAVTQEYRQEGFDNHETTDDHGMLIVGTATDQKGNKYYKVKNSWNTNQLYDGFIYVSEAYFLGKTINIVVNKNAVPKEISKKIK